MGIKSKKTPYEGLWISLPMMVLPSICITVLLYLVIAKWQPQFGFALNEESNAAFINGKVTINTESVSYELPKLSYTYKFCDEDGRVIAEKTTDMLLENKTFKKRIATETIKYLFEG